MHSSIINQHNKAFFIFQLASCNINKQSVVDVVVTTLTKTFMLLELTYAHISHAELGSQFIYM